MLGFSKPLPISDKNKTACVLSGHVYGTCVLYTVVCLILDSKYHSEHRYCSLNLWTRPSERHKQNPWLLDRLRSIAMLHIRDST